MQGYFPQFFYEWSIIQDLIISTAIQIRIIDDLYKTYNETYYQPNTSVGTLEIENEEVTALTFRESCNKIIHAKSFEPFTGQSKVCHKYGKENYFKTHIAILGSQGRINWKATIEIEKYCVNALSLMEQYGEAEFSGRDEH